MQWNQQQEQALIKVAAWLRDKDKPFFYLGGYAGTGKTTLARHFAQGVHGLVLFAAYTGKAAHVLQQKGCPDATTIHSLIYHQSEKSETELLALKAELDVVLAKLEKQPTRELYQQERELRGKIKVQETELEQPHFRLNPESPLNNAHLLVVDECSMVHDTMAKHLLSFKKPILVLGDPYQLPPVKGEGAFTKGTPDFMLTDVMRQAKDNPIVELATMIREDQRAPLGMYGDSSIISGKLTPEVVFSHDQMLVGKNVTRRRFNVRWRQLKERGPGPLPVVEDKLVCLRNNHELGLLNGSLWEVTGTEPVGDEEFVTLHVRSLDTGLKLESVSAHQYHFTDPKRKVSFFERVGAEEFDYGYALTCHKAQGSQWDNVLVMDEGGVFRENRWNWLYTAVTRAAERVTVVRN